MRENIRLKRERGKFKSSIFHQVVITTLSKFGISDHAHLMWIQRTRSQWLQTYPECLNRIVAIIPACRVEDPRSIRGWGVCQYGRVVIHRIANACLYGSLVRIQLLAPSPCHLEDKDRTLSRFRPGFKSRQGHLRVYSIGKENGLKIHALVVVVGSIPPALINKRAYSIGKERRFKISGIEPVAVRFCLPSFGDVLDWKKEQVQALCLSGYGSSILPISIMVVILNGWVFGCNPNSGGSIPSSTFRNSVQQENL